MGPTQRLLVDMQTQHLTFGMIATIPNKVKRSERILSAKMVGSCLRISIIRGSRILWELTSASMSCYNSRGSLSTFVTGIGKLGIQSITALGLMEQHRM